MPWSLLFIKNIPLEAKHTVRWDSLSSKLRSLLLRIRFDMDLTPTDYLTGLKKERTTLLFRTSV